MSTRLRFNNYVLVGFSERYSSTRSVKHLQNGNTVFYQFYALWVCCVMNKSPQNYYQELDNTSSQRNFIL